MTSPAKCSKTDDVVNPDCLTNPFISRKASKKSSWVSTYMSTQRGWLGICLELVVPQRNSIMATVDLQQEKDELESDEFKLFGEDYNGTS
ncbi:hypothetical protein IMY05_017G0060800 [Salix suchowensis]|nr:hypothetical protein IMY05_017G0060800 [Salix suchowensis]